MFWIWIMLRKRELLKCTKIVCPVNVNLCSSSFPLLVQPLVVFFRTAQLYTRLICFFYLFSGLNSYQDGIDHEKFLISNRFDQR